MCPPWQPTADCSLSKIDSRFSRMQPCSSHVAAFRLESSREPLSSQSNGKTTCVLDSGPCTLGSHLPSDEDQALARRRYSSSALPWFYSIVRRKPYPSVDLLYQNSLKYLKERFKFLKCLVKRSGLQKTSFNVRGHYMLHATLASGECNNIDVLNVVDNGPVWVIIRI